MDEDTKFREADCLCKTLGAASIAGTAGDGLAGVDRKDLLEGYSLEDLGRMFLRTRAGISGLRVLEGKLLQEIRDRMEARGLNPTSGTTRFREGSVQFEYVRQAENIPVEDFQQQMDFLAAEIAKEPGVDEKLREAWEKAVSRPWVVRKAAWNEMLKLGGMVARRAAGLYRREEREPKVNILPLGGEPGERAGS